MQKGNSTTRTITPTNQLVSIGDTFLTYVSPVIFVTISENMLSGRSPSWEYETRREKHFGV